jgi:bilirubin oxidase
MMAPAPADVDLLTLSTSLDGQAQPVALPAAMRPVASLTNPVRTQSIVLTESMGMGGNQFLINGQSFDPARVDLRARVNDIEDWTIDNQGDMDHPFHIHGNPFQLVSRTRLGLTTVADYPAWIDTVNVRAKEVVRIRLKQTMAGKRMFHCHILEHEDQGMMGILDVLA